MEYAEYPFYIGNRPEEDRPLLERAIAETDSPVLIRDEAADIIDRPVPGYISLWSKVLDDTLFLDVYRCLKAEQETA